jgi:hypothetical protein
VTFKLPSLVFYFYLYISSGFHRLLPAVLKPRASTATTFGFNNLSLRFEVDGMKYLLCVPLLSISSVSNDAEAATCSISSGFGLLSYRVGFCLRLYKPPGGGGARRGTLCLHCLIVSKRELVLEPFLKSCERMHTCQAFHGRWILPYTPGSGPCRLC